MSESLWLLPLSWTQRFFSRHNVIRQFLLFATASATGLFVVWWWRKHSVKAARRSQLPQSWWWWFFWWLPRSRSQQPHDDDEDNSTTSGDSLLYFAGFVPNKKDGSLASFSLLEPPLRHKAILFVACGREHFLAVTAQGEVFSWGQGEHGALGHGDVQSRAVAAKVEALAELPMVEVAAGHVMSASWSESRLFMWGRNTSRQLGPNTGRADLLVPTPLSAFDGMRVQAVRFAFHATFVLLASGDVHVWGASRLRVLTTSVQPANSPLLRTAQADPCDPYANVFDPLVTYDGGGERSALPASNATPDWGQHSPRAPSCASWNGSARSPWLQHSHSPAPHITAFVFDAPIKCLSVGAEHAAAVTATGQLITWGSNTYSQLGHDERDPATVSLPELVKQVSCGNYFTVALTDKGDVYTWGSNDAGQLGRRPQRQVLRNLGQPQKVELPGKPKVCAVSAGYRHVAAISEGGRLFVWGDGRSGQLGLGTSHGCADLVVWTPVQVAAHRCWKYINCGARQTCGIAHNSSAESRLDVSPDMDRS